MAETVDEAADLAEVQPPASSLCLCEQYVRVTEGGALTAARWLGRADQDAAEADAAAAMRAVLDHFPIRGRVVIGSAMEGSPLRAGEDIGAGGDTVDLALDPLEGRGVVARGGNGAMSTIEIEDARALGIEDPTRVFTTEELAPGEVIVVATGVSNGDLLRGVRFLTDSARTHSIVMCTRCNWVRFIDGIHFFARERREEVRLLGY